MHGRGGVATVVDSPPTNSAPWLAAVRSPLAEELAQKGSAGVRFHSADHLDSVIETWMPHHVADASAHPRLVVVGAEDQPPNLGQHDRPRALGARLERDIQRAVGKAVGTECLERPPEGEQFGVSGGVAAGYGLVVRSCHDRAIPK